MKTSGKLGHFMERFTWVLMGLDMVLMIALPWLIEALTSQSTADALYWHYLAFIYVSGIFAELVLWQCRGIMRNVNTGCAFSKNTVRRLRTVGTICLVLAVVYFICVIALHVFKFFTSLLLIVFAFIGLTLFLFAELFAQATAYKEENDMTI